MSVPMGRIVYVPAPGHQCDVPADPTALGPVYGYHQARRSCRPGSVFECACGRSWVVRADVLPRGWANRDVWVRESRWARWRRQRRAR